MRFEVPDAFLELIMRSGDYYSPSPSTLVDILAWASENKDAAEKVVEEVKKLNETGRREFEYNMFKLSCKPDEAVKKALEIQRERRVRRSLMSKVAARVRKGCYTLKLANGLKCKITAHDGDYVFEFNLSGANVKIIHNGRFIEETLVSLSRFSTFSSGIYGIKRIILDGKEHHPWERVGETVLEAIRRNTNPYIYMVVENSK